MVSNKSVSELQGFYKIVRRGRIQECNPCGVVFSILLTSKVWSKGGAELRERVHEYQELRTQVEGATLQGFLDAGLVEQALEQFRILKDEQALEQLRILKDERLPSLTRCMEDFEEVFEIYNAIVEADGFVLTTMLAEVAVHGEGLQGALIGHATSRIRLIATLHDVDFFEIPPLCPEKAGARGAWWLSGGCGQSCSAAVPAFSLCPNQDKMHSMSEQFNSHTSTSHPNDLPLMYARASFNDVMAFSAPLDNQLPFSTPPHTPTNVVLTSNHLGVDQPANLTFGADGLAASTNAACINYNSHPNVIPMSAVSYPMTKVVLDGQNRLQQQSMMPCAQCGQLFSDRFAHRAHVRTVHNITDEHLPGQVLSQLTIQQPTIHQIAHTRRTSIVHPLALSPTTPLGFATNHMQFQSQGICGPQHFIPASAPVAYAVSASTMLPSATVDTQPPLYTTGPTEHAQPVTHIDLQSTPISDSPADFQMFPYAFPPFESVKTPLVPSHLTMQSSLPAWLETRQHPANIHPVSDLTVSQIMGSIPDTGALSFFEPELTNSPAPSMTSVSTGLNDLLWSEDIGLGMLRPIDEEEDAPSSPPNFPSFDDDPLSDFCSSFPLPEFTELTPQSYMDNSSTPSPSILSDPFTFAIDISTSSNAEDLPRPPAQFPCKQCPLNFPKHSHLKRHIRHVHAPTPISPQRASPPPATTRRNSEARKLPKVIADALAQGLPKPRFPCANCERTFSRSDALARHVRTKGCYGPAGPPVGRKSSVASNNSHSAVAVE
ncbi:hypothetical protein BJ742DRAFT_741365 [Cladochytrium replicatum]|nr:hypothetical protein BJ742DRAFT_741365 [Cladochytrium replicatum]